MRHRFLTVILLSVVTSALSLAMLARILSITTAQRIERAREAVTDEASWLASQRDVGRALETLPEGSVVGMMAGVLGTQGLPARIPAEWGPLLVQARKEAASGQAVLEHRVHNGTLVLCVSPLRDGRAVWSAMLVRPPSYLRFWQLITIALAIATGLLVTVALTAVITFRRSTAALRHCLSSLAHDLSTPIPRPPISELAQVSDGIANLARDLARAREEQERLSQELAQKERLAALGRVVAGVAHEVRNPLASIKLHLDLAAATADLEPDVKKAVTHASEEITRLDRLVADLLVVSGRRTGPLRQVPLGQLVKRRVDALGPWVAAHEVSVKTEGDAEALVDPDSLGRALDNLLRNAVEASPKGGTVAVWVLNEQDGPHVRVEDHGVGISPDHSAELFEPFFTTKPDGTGLGLAISRAIARAHGGELSYRRQDGTTTFELSLARSGGAGQLAQGHVA